MTIGASMIQHGEKLQKVCLALLVAILCLALTPPVLAQSDNQRESITLSPTSRKYTMDAGETISDKLTIVNDGKTDYDFLVYARPYSIQDNKYTNPDFTNPTKNADLYGWVQFPKTKYHAKAGATVEVPYTISVPPKAAPGGHYGVIFAEVQPGEDQEASGNTIMRKKRVGAVVYATVNGKVILSGSDAGSSIPFWQVEAPMTVSAAAKNTGNTHFTDSVRMTVRDALGNVKYQSTADYQVLPGTTRTIDSEWRGAPWFGLFKVELEQKFLDKTVKTEGYVLMMPRFLPVLLLVMIVIGGAYAIRRKHKK